MQKPPFAVKKGEIIFMSNVFDYYGKMNPAVVAAINGAQCRTRLPELTVRSGYFFLTHNQVTHRVNITILFSNNPIL